MWMTTTMTVVDNGVRGSLDFELMHVSHGPVLVEARRWTIQTSTTRAAARKCGGWRWHDYEGVHITLSNLIEYSDGASINSGRYSAGQLSRIWLKLCEVGAR